MTYCDDWDVTDMKKSQKN